MARISFRQGIVSHQTDGLNTPTFLDFNNGFVTLVVSPDPTIIAFVHGDSDYLYTEASTVPNAWGPLVTTNTSWLYWDLSLRDGTITRGTTTLEPVEQASPPPNPAPGQMWYNIQTKMWFEWNGARWVEVVRVFAAQLIGGTVLQSMSMRAPAFTGTQVGLNVATRVGSLVFGSNRKPLRNAGTNTFFTTEDDFTTGVPTAASLRINNTVITGEAVCPLAAYQVVQYNDFGTICAANPAQEGRRLFGIIEEDAAQGEIVNFITEGVIFNEDWDWIADGATANQQVFINATGELSLTNVFQTLQPVGIVIGRQEILFTPRLFIEVNVTQNSAGDGATASQVIQIDNNTTTSSSNQVTLGGLVGTTIPAIQTSVDAATVDAATATTDAAAALAAANGRVSVTGDAMTGKLTTPLTVNADATNTVTTKSYVDQLTRGYQADFLSTTWVGSNPRMFLIPQSVHQLPLNTLYHVTILDSTTGSIVTVATEINQTTGLVTIKTNGAAFAGSIRIT